MKSIISNLKSGIISKLNLLKHYSVLILVLIAMKKSSVLSESKSYTSDIKFLDKYYDIVKLSEPNGKSQVVICPELQAKVMTSTVDSSKGDSFGYINYDLISSGIIKRNINPVGGEDRFWLGPEGGQYGIFFSKNDPFDLEHAITPAPLDREPFDFLGQDESTARFRKNMKIKNYSGTEFHILAERDIHLLTKKETYSFFGLDADLNIQSVGFESINKITNTGTNAWEKKSGLLSIWILGMFPPSDETVIICPYKEISEDGNIPIVNTDYFGNLPTDRIKIDQNKKVVYFKGDGKYRSKIGLSPLRAKSVIGSYDPIKKVLTIVRFTLPHQPKDYVNSMWEIQKNPFQGDVTNSYNDGPAIKEQTDYKGFYELETSSPALSLKPKESAVHIHQTFHFTGTEENLNIICKKVLGVDLKTAKEAL